MASKRTLDLTKGSIIKKLILFVYPIILSNLLQHCYTMADRVVVGNWAHDGEVALAAVGATGSATVLILNLFTGMAIGANVICSNLRGARKPKALRRAMHTALLLAGVCGICVSALGIGLSRPALELLDTPDKVIDQSTLYMRIYFMGVPASLVYNFGAAILRAHGDTRRPMFILACTGLVNVGLNLLLVIVFHMDVAGVAISTITAQYISAAVVLKILFSSKDEYKLTRKELKFHKEELKKIVSVGIPCGLNGMVFSVSNVTIQSSLNSFNNHIILAASTVASDVSAFVYQVIVAFYSGCISFSGQCYGARLYKRIDKLAVRSILVCMGLVCVVAGIATVFSDFLLGLYTDSQQVVDTARFKLLLLCWTYGIYGISETFLGCLRGMGRSSVPTLLNLLSICLPRVIWTVFIFPLNPTFNFLVLCYPISWVIGAFAQGSYFIYCRKKDNRKDREYQEKLDAQAAKAAQAIQPAQETPAPQTVQNAQ